MLNNVKKNDIVTLDLNSTSSNTFIVDTVEDITILLTHPLATGIFIRVDKDKINTVTPSIKDSSERGIDYANANKTYLDFSTLSDLEAVGIYFALKRKLTPRQKQTIANICGIIASVKFNNDLREAMNFIVKNSSILDEFNLMWFNNFKGLFNGTQQITSKKQRSAIFNIAGYVLAELENPMARTRK
jgi:hypothetical protein